jgi:hypothetical protein
VLAEFSSLPFRYAREVQTHKINRRTVKEELQYPFLDYLLVDLVKFAWQFGSGQGICQAECVILDERTLRDKTVMLVSPSERSDDMENGPRLTARSDFRSSLITLNVKSLGVGGDGLGGTLLVEV